jgi:manganese transport protein
MRCFYIAINSHYHLQGRYARSGYRETSVGGAWRRAAGEPSLAEVYRSVHVSRGAPGWRKAIAFLGPGYLVAVGYMDPGNWATSLAGGAKFGYALLFVALLSIIMAIVLQGLCARLAIATGRDLAQACRDAFPLWVAYPLWAMA